MHGLAVANGSEYVWSSGRGVWLRDAHLGTTTVCFCSRPRRNLPSCFPPEAKNVPRVHSLAIGHWTVSRD